MNENNTLLQEKPSYVVYLHLANASWQHGAREVIRVLIPIMVIAYVNHI